MHKKIVVKTLKATIISIIVALCFAGAIVLSIYLFCGAKIDESMAMVSKYAIEKEKKQLPPTTITEDNVIENYPEYGTQYATIEIPRIDINLPLYYGDDLKLLKTGIGQSPLGYFPGEGGSIVLMGHNFVNMFRRFSELQKGDKITIKATYGEYTYSIYDMQIIKETETDKIPIQDEKEILMVYTCYPFNNIGYATHRYVVYAELEK